MKKAVPFYPLLIALFPILGVYSANLTMIAPNQLVRPIVLTLLGTTAVWTLFSAIFRSWDKGAAAAMVSVLLFFGFSRLAAVSPTDKNSPVTLGLFVSLLIGLAIWAALKGNWTRQLNVLSSFVIVSSLSQIGFSFVTSTHAGSREIGHGAGVVRGQEPDIYYIILDGYGRSDALKRAIGYSNDWFIRALEKRGFYIADQSRANYCQTELSIPSSLNMDYLQRLLPGVRKADSDRTAVRDLLENNEVSRRLTDRGYEYVTVTTGFPIALTKSDRWIESRSSLSLLETEVLGMTPLNAAADLPAWTYEDRRKKVLGAINSLKSLAGRSTKPKFVVAHILAPHPPFVFGPNGEPRDNGPVSWYDGSDYLRHGTRKTYRKGYSEQAEFLNKQILKVVDTLAQAKGPRPIIIIQGDHGSKLRLDQNSLANTDLAECFPNLNAYLVPNEMREQLRPSITPVNSFRVVLNGLFGENLPQLPNRSWYSTYQQPYDFTEVTAQIPTFAERSDARGEIRSEGTKSETH